MALVVKDRVKEVTTTTGTSNLTLGGAVYGFQSFSVIGNGNTTYYGIYDSATGDWEVGVGTYSSTGPTLSRDTVLESSNSGSKVVFGAGSKDVFVTYPAERSVYLDAAGSAVTVLDVGTLGVGTANITTANITAGTISTTPTASNDLVNKTYVDGIAAQGISYHTPVKYEVPNTTGNLNATYNNGTGGVGATLTNNGTKAAFAPDGPTASIGDRVLIYNQTNAYENGVYEVTVVGTPDPGGTNWVLTRTADADSYGVKDPNALGAGDAFYVTSGNTGAGETYVCNTAGTITFGTTAITFAQISSAQVYSAGAGLTLSNLQFSITPVGTASTYGSSSSVPVFTTNAYGQVTSVTNTGIAISAGAVSGLAPSATTDTTNASNITSGTLDSARLAGSYTGITGVGTLTAGTWTANAIGAAYGGTGLTSYTVGDLLYANTTTSLAKLADVATGNALISGGVGTAPLWGKIGLQTHVNGTLQVVNGGTGATDATGARSNLGLVIGTDIPSVTGSGASGTWGINITGNAATATTATTSTTATSVSNSVTFNNSGTGAASGNGFNGSSALTVSYNTVGAPSTTGTNASGTWGISITGNSSTTSQRAFSGDISTTGQGRFTGWYTGNAATGLAAEIGISSGQGYIFVYNRDTGTYGTLNIAASAANMQFSGSTINVSSGALQQGGNQVLHAGNYNSYAPTLTGGGASGTWAINITGSAGSAGSVDYNNLTNKTGGTGTYTTSGDYRAPIFYDSNNTGYYVDAAGTSSLNNTVVNSAISSNNNGLRNIFPQGGTYVTGASSVSGAIRITLPTTNYPMIRFTVKAYTYDGLSFEISCGGHTSSGVWYNTFAYMTTQNRSALNVRFTYGGGQTFVYIGELGSSWSYPQIFITDVQVGYSTYDYTQWDDGWNITFDASSYQNISSTHTVYPPTSSSNNTNPAYASILYDANNTSYYVDPASTTFLYSLQLSGATYFRPNNWIELNSSYGLYWPSNYGAHLHANDLSSYTQLAIRGSKNGYGGIYDQASGVNGIMYDGAGNGGVYREGSGRWYFYYAPANDCMGIGTSSTSSTYSLYLNKGVFAQSRIDATIFYDTNNTSYYTDPASTSYMNALQSDRYSVGNSNPYDQVNNSPWYGLGQSNVAGPWGPNMVQLAGYYGVRIRTAYSVFDISAPGWGTDWIYSGYNMAIAGQARATIYYDYSDTGYYCDPNSTNRLYYVLADSVYAYGNVTAYSDERLKTDWAALPDDFIERLANLKSGTYTRIDTKERQVGVGAQGLQEFLPEAVSEKEEFLGVNYGNAALAACVELAKSVVALRAEINALRGQ